MTPIRPENKKRYPANWLTEIRPRILDRAGNRCEGSPAFPECRVANYEPHPVTGSKVVLTIAHISEVVEDCSDGNLLALCQKCHNSMDAAMRQRNRRARERAELEADGQRALFEGGE